jgi:transglutaminase-like putative cysteine protease
MNSYSPAKPLHALLLVCAFFSTALLAQDKDWRPVTSEELKLTAPKVEADADAEALLWEVQVADEDTGSAYQTVLRHYLKVKIFNERGREQFSKMDIPFGRIEGVGYNVKIKDIAARTTKPDGSSVLLKEADIFDRDVVKGDGVKLKAKSFATPGIEPGAVVEYRWKEVRGTVSYYQRLQFAREIPVHLVRYYIKPLPHPELSMSGQTFNATNTPFVKEKNGFYSTTVLNVPSFREEPRMPPEYSIRPWMLLYYTKDSKVAEDKFWKDHGRSVYSGHKDVIKVTDEVSRAAAEAVGGETDPEKKIEKIFHYTRAKVKYMLDDSLNLTAEQIEKLKGNKNASDALKRGQGTMDDINHAFAAMAIAAGFETRIVNLPRRSDIFFPRWLLDDYFMRTENVAVNVNGTWRYFDPGSKYIPYGMLRWEEEGQPALVSDPKEPQWLTTPMSEAVKSAEIRKGKFRLLEDGTLEGTASIEFTGHVGAEHKEYNDDDTPQQREETLKRIVRSSILGSAEISDITIENVSDPDKPFRYTFKVRVPGYASRTGKRIFVQPNVFERGSKPIFESAARRYEVYFQYPYSEQDELTIELPAGYELESPDAPERVADSGGISANDVQIFVSNDKKLISYKRNFAFGNKGVLRFKVDSYQALKGLFEAFYKANTHALTLRQGTATASN